MTIGLMLSMVHSARSKVTIPLRLNYLPPLATLYPDTQPGGFSGGPFTSALFIWYSY